MTNWLKALRLRVFLLAVVAALVVWRSAGPIKAQSNVWTPSYPMILTPERALALVQAADRKLDYVPDEVLVKFTW